MTTETVAAILARDGSFGMEEILLDDLRPDEILVRVAASGICHTDLSRRELVRSGAAAAPAILGHEGAGVVEAVGSAVASVQVDDHVLLTYDHCGRCAACLRGDPSYCEHFFSANMSGRRTDGSTAAARASGERVENRWFAQSSFARHAIATDRNAVVVPRDLPLEILAPLGCGVQTGAGAVLNEMAMRAGQSIVVFGAGAVGLSAVMAARIANARDIVVVDLNPDRLELALQLGATRTVHGADPEHVARTSPPGGFDFSLETTGAPSVLRTAVSLVRMRGKCVSVAPGDIAMPRSAAVGRTIVFCLEGSAVPRLFIPQLIEHWRAGDLPIDKLVTRYPLGAVAEAAADSLSGRVVKPVLIP